MKFRELLVLGVALASCSPLARAATYYVATNGNDNAAGSVSQPWRTIQKAANTMVAGDTALVSPGNYGESIMTKAHGTSTAPVRFRANPPNDPNQQVILRGFRVRNRFQTIEGFNLTGAQDLNNSVFRIEFAPPTIDGSNLVITNNTIRDGVYLISDDLRFNHLNNSITTLKENWLTKGFIPGGYIFLGSNSKNPYVNHDTNWRVKDVNANTIYLTNSSGTAFKPEPATNVWGVIYAGNGNDGFAGVEMVVGSSSAVSNCVIANNTFTNLFGCPLRLNGDNHVVQGNLITRLHGYYGLQPQGRNHIIRDNLWKDCTNFIFFTQQEIGSIPHPEGANFFDYQVAFISSFAPNSTNIVFERNWLQNIHNQMALVSQAEGSRGFIMRSNVFIGVQTHLSGSRSGLTIENNTFYRCSYDEGRANVLGLGGTAGQLQKDLVIRKNLFIDCGYHYSPDYEGYYSIVDSTTPSNDYNFVCAPETMGWAKKRYFAEPNGINGGDPVLVNPLDPLGPDKLPFTADDGLRPLPSSPFAQKGWGALPVLSLPVATPASHFRVVSPTGWFDAVGTNFNQAWVALEPYQRGDVIRPYTTPEALGTFPITVKFAATNSVAGTGATITAYQWQFGDGQSQTTQTPTATHSYTTPGNFVVALTVVNSQGNTATYFNRYRVLGGTGINRPLPPTNLRTVSTQ